MLCDKFGTKGKARVMYKVHGKSIQESTITDSNLAIESLKNGLKSEKVAYIYHCFNHYMVILGYEDIGP